MLSDFHPGSPERVAAMRGDQHLDAEEEPHEPASIQVLREERGVGLVELAGLAGLLPDHLRAIEAGVEPTMPEKQALAAALNIPIERIA